VFQMFQRYIATVSVDPDIVFVAMAIYICRKYFN
jgi:hypothetical protein